MPFITQGKANVKYLLILGLVAAVSGGIIFAARNSYYKDIVNLDNFSEIKKPANNIKGETTDWKTYKNEEYGFEIKYPADWGINSYVKNRVVIVCDFVNTDTGEYKTCQGLEGMGIGAGIYSPTITVRDNLSLQDFIKEYNNPPLSSIISQQAYTIDGVSGFKLVGTTEIGTDQSIIFITKGDKSYIIYFNDSLSINLEMLSTFKFIENIYTACGCGCCIGVEPTTSCLYHSKGDDIQKIIEQDKKTAQSPNCSTAGCSKPVQYYYCD